MHPSTTSCGAAPLRQSVTGRTSWAMNKTATPPQPRHYDGVNWIGLRTLYLREVKRFWKVGTQTVLAPVVTTLLYMMVFVVAVRGAQPMGPGVDFAHFVGPGLIMMAIMNNAFANSSASILQAKMMGLTPDFLTPPSDLAIWLAESPSSHSFFSVSTRSSVQPMVPPPAEQGPLWSPTYCASTLR